MLKGLVRFFANGSTLRVAAWQISVYLIR
jgi:hypothetical protein